MKSLLFFLFFIPAICCCQKIVRSGIDKKSKKYIIETTKIQAKMDLDDIIGLWLRSEDTTIYLVVTGLGGTAGKINEEDQLIFLLDNNRSVMATSTTLQTYQKDRTADNYSHEYYITSNELSKLPDALVETIKMYVSNRFITLDIKEKRAKLISSLAEVFLQEYNSKKQQFKGN